MIQDPWTDRLSEYVDGELPEWERHALESHLESCTDCSVIVSDLRRVVRRARTLKNPPPATDLWPGIAARIGAGAAKAHDVVDLSAQRRVRRRWAFSLPQLAAAGIALMTVSGGTVWFLSGSARQSVVLAPTPSAPSASAPAVSVSMRPSAAQSYAVAVADLERVLAEGRGKLDTTTVKIIEKNLAAIDRAIAEAQRALDADSGNLYLNTHLAETMRRKLDLLRQAAALVPVS
jgi:anti-sigma factor RsiW